MQLFSISSGSTHQPGAAWTLPPEPAPPAEPTGPAAEDPAAEVRRQRRWSAGARRRARTADGRLRGDDPTTPENEAWEDAAEPVAEPATTDQPTEASREN